MLSSLAVDRILGIKYLLGDNTCERKWGKQECAEEVKLMCRPSKAVAQLWGPTGTTTHL